MLPNLECINARETNEEMLNSLLMTARKNSDIWNEKKRLELIF
jgi:hypothetical protein